MSYLFIIFGFMKISSIFVRKEGIMLSYIHKVKPRNYIGLQTTCVYQHCGQKTGFYIRAIFDQFYFVLPVLQKYCFFLHGKFTILTVCLYYKEI